MFVNLCREGRKTIKESHGIMRCSKDSKCGRVGVKKVVPEGKQKARHGQRSEEQNF